MAAEILAKILSPPVFHFSFTKRIKKLKHNKFECKISPKVHRFLLQGLFTVFLQPIYKSKVELYIQNRLQKDNFSTLQDYGLVIVIDIFQLAFDGLILTTSLLFVRLEIGNGYGGMFVDGFP